MSSNKQPLQEERLHEEIQELRRDLGETVEALVHKADLPARAKDRGNKIRTLAAERGSELRDRAIDTAGRARVAIGQTSTDRGAKLVATGALLITLMVLVRRVRRS